MSAALPVLPVLRHPAAPSAETLVVLLPGAHMQPQDFIAAGFAAALASHDSAVDLALPALGAGQLSDGSGIAALHDEIILPARREGYRQVWLGGISLGGYAALDYASRQREQIDGLCLLAPYPGSRISIAEICAGGGPANWQPRPEQLADADFRIWHWLQTPPADLPIHYAFGRDDRFADNMALLAAALPRDSVRQLPGGHDWPVWSALWQDFLDRRPFAQRS